MQKRAHEDISERYACSWCGHACDESQLVPWEDWLPGIRNILEHNKHFFDHQDCLYTYCKVYYRSGSELHATISQRAFDRYRSAPKYVPLLAKHSPPHNNEAAANSPPLELSVNLSFEGLLGSEEDNNNEETDEEWQRRLELIKTDMPWPQHSSNSTELVVGGESMFLL